MVCTGHAFILHPRILILFTNRHQSIPQAMGAFAFWLYTLYCISDNLYSDALYNALFDPIGGLYSDNALAPLQQHHGIREVYKFGLYSHCGYMNATAGICSHHVFSYRFTPYPIITSDMSANYSAITDALVLESSFRDSDALGSGSRAAYWMIFLGTVTSFFALCSLVFPLPFHPWHLAKPTRRLIGLPSAEVGPTRFPQ